MTSVCDTVLVLRVEMLRLRWALHLIEVDIEIVSCIDVRGYWLGLFFADFADFTVESAAGIIGLEVRTNITESHCASRNGMRLSEDRGIGRLLERAKRLRMSTRKHACSLYRACCFFIVGDHATTAAFQSAVI